MDINKINAILEEEGFRPEIDDEGGIVFKYEGGNYYVEVDREDPPYIRVMFPGFWSLDSEEESAKAPSSAIQATRGTKVAKVFPLEGNVFASAELFLPDEPAWRQVLPDIMAALQTAAEQFRLAMLESGEQS